MVELEGISQPVIDRTVAKNSSTRAKSIFRIDNDRHFTDLVKGSSTHLAISLFEEGFFGGETCVGGARIESGSFSRELDQPTDTAVTESIRVEGVLRVRAPTRPITK